MGRTREIWLSLASCLLVGLFAGGLLTQRQALADKDKDEKVHELMEKTHEGKRSPWRKTVLAAQGNPIDWATINQALPRLTQMSKSLETARDKDVRDASQGYVDAVKELTLQANKRDAVRTRAALTSLSNSCADCHYKGGPGGKLD